VLCDFNYLPQKSVQVTELPHLTWCTTGPLAFLPLHAAGCYNGPGNKIFDYVISSYTPTLSALLAPPPSANEFRGILAVGQAATFGCAPLPGTVAEIDAIQKHAKQMTFTRLEEDKATAATVLRAMEEHSWVHLACHASQNTSDPTKSAFYLHGSQLDLTMITQKPLRYAALAFLSACQTAMGDESLPEEAVHLAAGMVVAGYPTVIATMWSIEDEDAPFIAEKVYAHLLDGGVADSRKAAKALHISAGSLRDKVGVKEFARWLPYIHIGL
jgi:CHAT domain-containing protein